MNAAEQPPTGERRTTADLVLAGALAALGALYLFWYRDDPHRIATTLVFAAPALLMSLLAARGGHRLGRFLPGVFALFWFSHGVMTAWTYPDQRACALVEIALSMVIIFAANMPALRSRFGARRN